METEVNKNIENHHVKIKQLNDVVYKQRKHKNELDKKINEYENKTLSNLQRSELSPSAEGTITLSLSSLLFTIFSAVVFACVCACVCVLLLLFFFYPST